MTKETSSLTGMLIETRVQGTAGKALGVCNDTSDYFSSDCVEETHPVDYAYGVPHTLSLLPWRQFDHGVRVRGKKMRGGNFCGSDSSGFFRKLIHKHFPTRVEQIPAPGLLSPSSPTQLHLLQHELRTPLTGIMGMSELLQASSLSFEQRRILGALEESGRQLERLLAAMSSGSPATATGNLPPFQPLDGPRFMEQIIRAHWPAALGKGIGLYLAVDHRLPDCWNSDASRLRQILDNLLTNAIKFTHQGYVLVEARLAEPGERGADSVEVRICDTGIGIAGDKTDRIFKAGEQGGRGVAEGYGGYGLGLFICRQLVSSLGGSLTHEPARRGGSCFKLNLPGVIGQDPMGKNRLRPGVLSDLHCQVALDGPLAKVVTGLLLRLGVRSSILNDQETNFLPLQFDALICDPTRVSATTNDLPMLSGRDGPLILSRHLSSDPIRSEAPGMPGAVALPQPVLRSNLEPLLLQLALLRKMHECQNS